jgi:hypothetical protein
VTKPKVTVRGSAPVVYRDLKLPIRLEGVTAEPYSLPQAVPQVLGIPQKGGVPIPLKLWMAAAGIDYDQVCKDLANET